MRKLGVATPEQRVSLTESESAAAAAAASSTAHGTTQTSPEETGESATNTETAQGELVANFANAKRCLICRKMAETCHVTPTRMSYLYTATPPNKIHLYSS